MTQIGKLCGVIGAWEFAFVVWAKPVFDLWAGAWRHQAFNRWTVDAVLICFTVAFCVFWWKVWPHARRQIVAHCCEVVKQECYPSVVRGSK